MHTPSNGISGSEATHALPESSGGECNMHTPSNMHTPLARHSAAAARPTAAARPFSAALPLARHEEQRQ